MLRIVIRYAPDPNHPGSVVPGFGACLIVIIPLTAVDGNEDFVIIGCELSSSIEQILDDVILLVEHKCHVCFFRDESY